MSPAARTSRERGTPAPGPTLADLVVVARRYPLTILAVAAATVALGAFHVGTQRPVYRAQAMLVLETGGPSAGSLGELAALSASPVAASEMALLRSRRIASATVGRPDDGELAQPGHPDYERHLGLAAVADDRALLPLATLVQRLTGSRPAACRLFVDVERRSPGAPDEFRVEFVDEDTVKLSTRAWFGLSRGDVAERDVAAGAPLEWNGLRLRMHALGETTGRRFVVRAVDEDTAVKRLLASTRVVEAERNTGVLQVTVDDSDPRRAAETVNALCRNYLDQNVERGRRKASKTLDFIESQLAVQDEEVTRATRELVELQAAHPEVIDLSASAQSLIERMAELSLERTRHDVRAAALDEALALLRDGEVAALSRVPLDAIDPITLGYVAEIGVLSAQSDQQDRSDAGRYRLLLQENLLTLEGAFDAAQLEIDALSRVVGALEDGDDEALARLERADPLTTSLIDELGRLDAEVARLGQEFTEEYPPLATARAARGELAALARRQLGARLDGLRERQAGREELVGTLRDVLSSQPGEERARIREALGKLEARALAHLESRRAGIEGERDALDRQIARAESELGELPAAERRLAEPKRRLGTHVEIQRFLRTSLEQARITHASTTASADLIDPAVPPSERSAPRVGFTLALAGVLGLGLGLGLAVMRERTRGSLHTQTELEETTGLPIFGAIPDFRHGALRVQTPGAFFLGVRDDPQGPIAEAYRSLRANLRFVVTGDRERREPRTLALTSCTPGEGKSTTNIALALAFANAGRRVLLVDTDLRKPSVHRFLNRPRSPGMTDVLGRGMGWRTCVQESVSENLDLVSAGSPHPSPGDLLLKPEIGTLVEELASSYDIVIFDLPPALAVSDVSSFAHALDAILLVYRAGGLPRTAVETAVASLRQSGANLVGAVLNAARPSRGERERYGYGTYGYGEESA